MTASETLLLAAAATVVAVLVMLVVLIRRIAGHPRDGRRTIPGPYSPARDASLAGTSLASAPDDANELLRLRGEIESLSRSAAGWPVILDRLNPSGDAAIAADLLTIRGPHLFAPHLALDILRAACVEALDRRSPASVRSVIADARRSAERVTRYGD